MDSVASVRYRFVKWSKMADSQPASFLLHIYESGGNPFFMNLSGRRHFSDRGASPVQTAHAFLTGEHTLDKMPQIYSEGKQLGELFQFCAGSQWWIMRGLKCRVSSDTQDHTGMAKWKNQFHCCKRRLSSKAWAALGVIIKIEMLTGESWSFFIHIIKEINLNSDQWWNNITAVFNQ